MPRDRPRARRRAHRVRPTRAQRDSSPASPEELRAMIGASRRPVRCWSWRSSRPLRGASAQGIGGPRARAARRSRRPASRSRPTAEDEEELHNATCAHRARDRARPPIRSRSRPSVQAQHRHATGTAGPPSPEGRLEHPLVPLLRGARAATTACALLPPFVSSSTRGLPGSVAARATASRRRRTPRASTGCSTTGAAR